MLASRCSLEKKSEKFWEILKITILKYKKIGLWGTLIKTCCGSEDPSWWMCKDKIRELNELLRTDKEYLFFLLLSKSWIIPG